MEPFLLKHPPLTRQQEALGMWSLLHVASQTRSMSMEQHCQPGLAGIYQLQSL